MTTEDEQHLMASFAAAFLRSLSGEQMAHLRSVIENPRVISSDDLNAVPGLRDLAIAGNGAEFRLPDAVRAVLIAHLSSEEFAESEFQPLQLSPFLAITKGAEFAETCVAGVPETQVAQDLNFGLFKVVQALKSGDLARADALMAVLSEHFDIPPLEQCGPGYAPELCCVLFMKAIYADNGISKQASKRLFDLLATVPKQAFLLRAILYNVILDVELRQQNLAAAEGAAHRALFHYNAAGESGVTFYVHIYLAVISLWSGDLATARGRLGDARLALAEFDGAVPNDDLLLASFEMIAGYEAGDSDAFVKHLMRDGDTIPFGELWPSIANPIISYGRRALAAKVTTAAALSWVRRWRVRQMRSQRFDMLISAQEALALQDLGRWQEADEILADIDAKDDVDVHIARLASGVNRAPKSMELARRIGSLCAAPDLSVRQAVVLRLLAALSALNRNMEREAARHIGAAIKMADPAIYPAIWDELRGLVASIYSKRELRAELKRFPKLQRQIKTLAEAGGTPKPTELTHQEFRVLQLLAEAQPNKAIAMRLGIALPTVKFHVKNLCRKTSAGNRRDVVRAAIRLGWLVEL